MPNELFIVFQVSHFIIISQSGGLFSLMKNTRGKRSSLLPENMPKVSLLLVQTSSSIPAWNRGRVTYTAGRVDTAQYEGTIIVVHRTSQLSVGM